MWRYQQNQNTFTTDTWFCRRCQEHTHWKIYALDIPLIPQGDLPETWGTREEFLAQVRLQRLEARNKAQRRESTFYLFIIIGLLVMLLVREFQLLDLFSEMFHDFMEFIYKGSESKTEI